MGTKQFFISILTITTMYAADSPPLHPSLDDVATRVEKLETQMGKVKNWASGKEGTLDDLADYTAVGGLTENQLKGPAGGADQALEMLWRVIGDLKTQVDAQAAHIAQLEKEGKKSHYPAYSIKTAQDDWLDFHEKNWSPSTHSDLISPPERHRSLPDLRFLEDVVDPLHQLQKKNTG